MSRVSTAVVTGGGRGIGLAIARLLVARGHQVLVTDVDEARAAAAAESLGPGAWSAGQDVRDPASHDAVADLAADRGRLAVWVNNAGILEPGPGWEQDPVVVQRLLDVNVVGTIHGCAAAVRAMGAAGGRILNVASISALTPVPGLALYAASKAAVLSYTTSLQGDLRHAGLPIKVRALCPDVVETPMVRSRERDPGAAMLFSGPKPLSPESVAHAGLELLDARQVFRVVPRWRGIVARSADLAPSVGLVAAAGFQRLGERRQQRLPHGTKG